MRDRLVELLGDDRRVSTGASVLEHHAGDLSYHPRHSPDVVVFPESTEDVARVLAWANDERVPVVPFGAGTSLEAHVIPVHGGISLDLSRMNRVLEVLPGDLQVRVQPGVLRSEVNVAVAEHGLWFPVDPGADASLGGMAATNASGTTTVRYGGMRPNVLGLEAVLADGTVIRPGTRTVKTSAGYDLRSLFVGSEGTLGVITELTLRLHALPEQPIALRAAFRDVGAACRSAVSLVGAGVTVTRCELLDEATLRAVNAFEGTSYAELPSLFVEVDGEEALASAREVLGWEDAVDLEAETTVEARTRLWRARHHAAHAVAALAPGKRWFATDVCVPLSTLPEAVEHARACTERRGIAAAVTAHAADGNYHLVHVVDPDDPADVAAAQDLYAELVEWALERGGTSTGEHGIGLGKIDYLEREHGDLVPYLRALKQVFDPNGILNPGKVVREEAGRRR
ncbi:MAG TPA: FAD-linked oxidase C-terminal domain-containing protein [Gaiellaceae bacterium]|nr:FAD-linked oxidase C-terminal domain-containing protein [Gaiellaceae bacterium]